MKIAESEVTVGQVSNTHEETIQELSELQLAIVGGGSGEVVFH